MKINQKGLAIIKEFEGYRSVAYKCPAGVWTLGYGTTDGIRPGMTCTEHDAEVWLKRDVAKFEQAVSEAVTVPLSENQFSALVSFVYNIGAQAFRESTLLRKLNQGDHDGAAAEFDRWKYGGGQVLPGLVKRRDAEESLFRSSTPVNTGNLKFFVDGHTDGLPITDLSSAAVKDLQMLLINCGHPLTVDGIVGPNTKSAWASFKKSIYQGKPDLIGKGSYDALIVEAVERKTGMEPKDPPTIPQGALIQVPGISVKVGLNQPVYEGSNFTWAEMTKGGQRIPVNAGITEQIVKLCRYMDGVRSYLGNKRIHVTSAYRDPATNQAVGGASRSRHMAGDAIDFYVEGENPVDTFNKLKSYHRNGGLAVGNGFVHLDLRPGGPVRWRYAGAHPNIALW